MILEIMLNNQPVKLSVENDEFLLTTLRKYGLYSVRSGCDTSNCGLCTVWLNHKPVLSCSILSARLQGESITTIEGVQKEAEEFADFLAKEGADQCGYCSPGLIMTVLAMKRELLHPHEEDIRHYLSGNLCRCTGYVSQIRAIQKYLAGGDA